MNVDILIMGSGSVCETTCRALALMSPIPTKVAVLGRAKPKVDLIVSLANAMSGALNTKVSFVGDTIHWDSANDLPDKIDKYSPRLIFQAASLQSPWEFWGDSEETCWKQLLWAAGNAITVPTQVALGKRVAEIVRQMNPEPIFVNACFPDHVNPILKYLDLPITCGIGNVAMFASCVRSRYPQPEHRVQIIGHLYHYFKILGKNHTYLDGPRVWIDGKEVPDVEKNLADAFRDLRSVNNRGKMINELVGTNSAEAIQALLGDVPVMTHVPGPNGLPGGYPVIIQSGKVELDLPADCSEEEAIILNKQGGYNMGAAIIDNTGFSAFSTTAMENLIPHSPSLARGFHADDIDEVCKEIIDLRTHLEQQPVA